MEPAEAAIGPEDGSGCDGAPRRQRFDVSIAEVNLIA
jgi:hypothetical protein